MKYIALLTYIYSKVADIPKKHILFLSFLIFIMLQLLPQIASSAEVELSIDNNYVCVGDIIQIDIKLTTSKIENIDFETSDLNPEKLKVVSKYFSFINLTKDNNNIDRVVTEADIEGYKLADNGFCQILETSEDDNRVTDIKLIVQYYTISDMQLNPIKFIVKNGKNKQIIYTPTISIYYRSVMLSDDNKQSLKDIFAPFKIKLSILDEILDHPFISILILIILLSIILIPIIYLRRMKDPINEFETLKTPWKLALEELEELKSSNYLEDGLIKEYFVILSHIIRKFLARMLKLFILETTTERMPKLLKNNKIDNEIIKLIYTFLAACDRVKFAKFRPNTESIDKITKLSFDIVKDITNYYTHIDLDKIDI